MANICDFSALREHAKQHNTQLQLPSYDRSQLETKIVHFGFGAFHRAHQALVLDALLNRIQQTEPSQFHNKNWGICEVSLFTGQELIQQLRDQDHLFSALEKSAEAEGDQLKVIGSVKESLTKTLDGGDAILAKLTEPQIAIVSMTITEKGYCIDAATGSLDLNNPLIQADLNNPTQPSSVIGFLVEAIKRRRDLELAPFSIMSCDNIQENGHVTRQAVIDFAKAQDANLAAWIAKNISFPNTMVDRIVPAITPEVLDEISTKLGVMDPVGIACEPFLQWVIEDDFVAGRPDWDNTGDQPLNVQFVEDVLPFETMKLRMLNGSHSFLAYLGYLAGYQTIYQTMQDPHYRQAALNLMLNEQKPTLNVPDSFDLEEYAQLLIARYSNPKMEHKTWQIAMDGSQKLPQRALKSIERLLENNQDISYLSLLVAGWMRYVGGVDEQHQPIDVRDPMSKQLAEMAKQQKINDLSAAERVAQYLSLNQIFPDKLANNAIFVAAVTQSYQDLIEKGAKQTVMEMAVS